MHVVTPSYMSCPRAPHFICITQAAEKGGSGPSQGLKAGEGV